VPFCGYSFIRQIPPFRNLFSRQREKNVASLVVTTLAFPTNWRLCNEPDSHQTNHNRFFDICLELRGLDCSQSTVLGPGVGFSPAKAKTRRQFALRLSFASLRPSGLCLCGLPAAHSVAVLQVAIEKIEYGFIRPQLVRFLREPVPLVVEQHILDDTVSLLDVLYDLV
jgi:hypothetical protein